MLFKFCTVKRQQWILKVSKRSARDCRNDENNLLLQPTSISNKTRFN